MDRLQAANIIGSDLTVSDKIRALDAAGFPRAEIARLLNKRYQHVRNVLEADRLSAGPAQARSVAETGSTFRHGPDAGDTRPSVSPAETDAEQDVERRGPDVFRLVVREDGSVVLPREVRETFGVTGGGAVMARLEGDEFKLIGVMTGLRRAQEMVRRYIPDDVSLVDELLADRRREAQREDRE